MCDVGCMLLVLLLLICNISLLVGGERSDRDLHSHPTSRVVGTIHTYIHNGAQRLWGSESNRV
jgi:hypothetical protein